LVKDVPLVGEVPRRALLPGTRLRVERLRVHRVDAPQLEPAFVDAPTHVGDHPEVLPLVEPAHRGRVDEHRRPAVAEDEHLHVAAERRAAPLSVVALHRRFTLVAADTWLFSMSAQALRASRQPPSFTSAW